MFGNQLIGITVTISNVIQMRIITWKCVWSLKADQIQDWFIMILLGCIWIKRQTLYVLCSYLWKTRPIVLRVWKNIILAHTGWHRITVTEQICCCFHYTTNTENILLFKLTMQSYKLYDSWEEITWSVFKHDLMSLSAFSHNANKVVRSVFTSSCLVIYM